MFNNDRRSTPLKTIKISSLITSIGSGAFYDCSSLSEIIFESGLSIIGESMFSMYLQSPLLRVIAIPSTITSIGILN